MAAAFECWRPILFGAAYKRNVGQSLLFKTMSEEHGFMSCGLCAEHRERDASHSYTVVTPDYLSARYFLFWKMQPS